MYNEHEKQPNSEEFPKSYPTCHGETQASSKHPERNEDALCTGKTFAGVFDGVGSKKGSEVASHMVAEYCEAALDKLEDELYPHEARYALEGILYNANSYIAERAKKNGGNIDWNTTAVIVKIFTHPETGAKFVAEAHAGDSRMYHIRDGKIVYKTTDHSSEFFETGGYTSKELPIQDAIDNVTCDDDLNTSVNGKSLREIFKKRNLISSCLTSEEGVKKIHLRNSNVYNLIPKKDVILLTSDGIHDNLSQQEIEAICETYKHDPHKIPDALIVAAEIRSYGGRLRSKIDDMTATTLTVQ